MMFAGYGNKWQIMAPSHKLPNYIKDLMKQFPLENGYTFKIKIRKCFMNIEVFKE